MDDVELPEEVFQTKVDIIDFTPVSRDKCWT
jgi:hypothetical protein